MCAHVSRGKAGEPQGADPLIKTAEAASPSLSAKPFPAREASTRNYGSPSPAREASTQKYGGDGGCVGTCCGGCVEDQCPTGNDSGTRKQIEEMSTMKCQNDVKDQCPTGNDSGTQYTATAASAAAPVEDDIDDDSDCCDLVDSTTEEELMDDDDTDSEIVEFIDWRMDDFASVYVGQKIAGRPRVKRKVRRRDLPRILQRRGPIARAKQAEMKSSKDSLEERADHMEPNAHFGNKIVTSSTKFLRSSIAPSPIETAAVEVIDEFNRQVEAEVRRRMQEARLLPVTPGSTESWLSGTDDGSQSGGVNQEHASGTPSQPKPQSGLSTLIPRIGSAISAVQSPDDWIEIEVTVDSGACETVMPSNLCQGIEILRSAMSHGQEYEVANGATIPNLGERRCLMMTLGAKTAKKIVFQVADVHKPLLSISRCADMGFRCHLGAEGGYMEDTVTGETIP